MNARDSEKLSGILEQAGYVLTESEEADFDIYNTCTVRDNADQRVYGRLGRLNSLKKKNPGMKVALCGCMMQEPGTIEKIQKSYRFVDLIFGTHNIYKFAELLNAAFEQDGMIVTSGRGRTGSWRTFRWRESIPLNPASISCSAATISAATALFPMCAAANEAETRRTSCGEIERLAADGVVEVMLLGQNVNSYGKNLEQPVTFAELLSEVVKIDGIRRVRFMTSHPKDLSDDLIR